MNCMQARAEVDVEELIDRSAIPTDTHHYKRLLSSILCAHAQRKPDDPHKRIRCGVCACVEDFLPFPARSSLHRRPVMPATGVTPHSYQT